VNIQRSLAELSPHSEAQRRLQERVIQIAGEGLAARQLAPLQAAGSTPMPLLITIVLWLCIIFGSFALFTSPNTTVITTFFLGVVSTSIAIFLILEMNTPLGGDYRCLARAGARGAHHAWPVVAENPRRNRRPRLSTASVIFADIGECGVKLAAYGPGGSDRPQLKACCERICPRDAWYDASLRLWRERVPIVLASASV